MEVSVGTFWGVFGGLVTLIIAQLVAFTFGYGKLTQQVKDLKDKVDKGFTCPAHNKVQEDLIRMEERANMAKEIAMAVATAKVDWEKMYKGKFSDQS